MEDLIIHNDMSPEDINIVSEHEKLINQESYDEAVNLLNNNEYSKGFRAFIFNNIEKKIEKFQMYLLNKYVAMPEEFYSIEEPTEEQMNDKIFWVRPYKE